MIVRARRRPASSSAIDSANFGDRHGLQKGVDLTAIRNNCWSGRIRTTACKNDTDARIVLALARVTRVRL
jgi:hypothetical protein